LNCRLRDGKKSGHFPVLRSNGRFLTDVYFGRLSESANAPRRKFWVPSGGCRSAAPRGP
jgi:hypothetical protein